MDSNGEVEFYVASVGRRSSSTQFDITSAQAINNGQWYYIAAVRNGDTGYLYIDGVLAGTGSGTATSLSSDGVSIGGNTYSGDEYFDGKIDDVSVYTSAISANGIASLASAAPTIATAAAASPSTVTGTTTALSVQGSDDAGASVLTYTWAVTGTPPAPVAFSANGTNAAQDTTATFTAPGVYNFTVTAVDGFGLEVVSSVSVTVVSTLTSISVSPSTAALSAGGEQQFTATGLDQFGNALATQPNFTWAATTGSISSGGLYSAPDVSANATVKASSGAVSGTAAVTVTDYPPTVAAPAAAAPSTVTGTTTALSVLGADDAGASVLTYTWAATNVPAGASAPTFSANGTNAAQNTTATFFAAGAYTFTVTITDAGGLTVASSVGVTVDATFTSIAVSPLFASLSQGGTQQFTATALDQFGNALATQPTFTWVATVGSITDSGVYTAPDVSTNATIQAQAGSIMGAAVVQVINSPPTVATPAAAAPSTVTGTTAVRSVLGADNAGESNLTYTWTATVMPSGAIAPTYSINGTNAAKDTTATFFNAGDYTFTVTITNAGGLTTTSSADVTVAQTFSSIVVSPSTAALNAGGSQQFAATALDQFGAAMATQPSIAWTATAGSITDAGLFTAPDVSAVATVDAASGAIDGTASVTVTNQAPTLATPAAATPSPVTGTTTALSVLGADDAGEANLTYTWAATSLPAGAASPTFSSNGANASKNTTATFLAAGDYTFTVTITDAGGLTAASSVDVTVQQTMTGVAIAPLATDLGTSGTEPFAATALDQFGNALATQPTFTWSVVGSGTIDSSGNFAPPYMAGSATVVATAGTVTGTYEVTFPGSAEWTSTTSGSWDSGTVWTATSQAGVADPGLRDVAGDTVIFDTSSPVTVSLDGADPSVAGISFAGSGGDEVAQGSGGTLQLDNGGSPATVAASAGSNTISAPVALLSNVVLAPAAGSQLNVSGNISGAGQSLSVDGSGTVVLSGANSYSGGTTVSTGTLVETSAASIPANTGLTIGAGGVFIFDPTSGASPVAAASAAAVSSAAATSPVETAVSVAASASPATAASSVVDIALHVAAATAGNAPAASVAHSPGRHVTEFSPTTVWRSIAARSGVASAHDAVLRSLIAKSFAAGVPWPSASNADSAGSNQPQVLVAIQALDALFSQYGQ